MRKNLTGPFATFISAGLLCACGSGDSGIDAATHRDDVLQWRNGRLERLLAPSGFLTLSGLFWLEPGEYSFGSDSANDLVFPSGAAPVIGRFTVSESGIAMSVAEGVAVTSDDVPVTSIHIDDDNMDAPITIKQGKLAWTAIQRDGRFAVRLRDYANPALASFGELHYFDINQDLRMNGKLRRYDKPRTVQVGTVIEGLGWNPKSPGTVAFEIDGVDYEIEAYESGDSLFYVFGDLTNRDDTYGAGRFLYSELPDDDGNVILDFNFSYSPPCAFNDFATCPVASPRNRLPIRIEAGEKFNPALYHGSQH